MTLNDLNGFLIIVESGLQIYIARDILLQLDFESLVNAEQVSQAWKSIFEGCKLWERIHNSYVTTNQYLTPNPQYEPTFYFHLIVEFGETRLEEDA